MTSGDRIQEVLTPTYVINIPSFHQTFRWYLEWRNWKTYIMLYGCKAYVMENHPPPKKKKLVRFNNSILGT